MSQYSKLNRHGDVWGIGQSMKPTDRVKTSEGAIHTASCSPTPSGCDRYAVEHLSTVPVGMCLRATTRQI